MISCIGTGGKSPTEVFELLQVNDRKVSNKRRGDLSNVPSIRMGAYSTMGAYSKAALISTFQGLSQRIEGWALICGVGVCSREALI